MNFLLFKGTNSLITLGLNCLNYQPAAVLISYMIIPFNNILSSTWSFNLRNIIRIFSFILLAFSASSEGQFIKDDPKTQDIKNHIINLEPDLVNVSLGPNRITRTIKQDRNGNIWIASWEGIFRYDGKSFVNMTSKVSTSRFLSILEDSKGNLWFGSIGSGVYYYDGDTFRNYTTKDGLVNDNIQHIYEDKVGNIWFATQGGASYYDGKSFHDFTIKDGLPNNDLNSIIEDKAGNFWFASRGEMSIYDGKKVTLFTKRNGQTFMNVRSIIKDKNDDIWLGGEDGLWRYDGHSLINITTNFVGYIYEDKKGSIWTSSNRLDIGEWAVTRYDENISYPTNVTANHIWTEQGMSFGILEDNTNKIWFGTLRGVCVFDGNTVNCPKKN
jgi:ligand-binding sensor domain-containing protein